MKEIKRVAVLGSGVMGSAIAAHLANCGIPSLMLDIVPPDLPDPSKASKAERNAFAEKSKQSVLKAKPSPIYRKSLLDWIEVGNFEDDIARIAECDWIVEVVKEDVEIKKRVFAQVAKHRKPGTVVTTNTSGILIQSMVEGMDDDMRKHFFCTHFFNPPRYLKLLEFVPGPDTLPEVIDDMAEFSENVLGKGVVRAKDTPNFVANRILTFSCQWILNEFPKFGLSVEDVDMLTGPSVGHARSATFRTLDLVGIDTYVHVIGNVYNGCLDDEKRDLFVAPDYVQTMLDKGMLGEKSGLGFFKKTDERDEKGKRIILSLDVDTLEHTPQQKTRFDCTGAVRNLESLEEKVKVMHTGEDKGSKFVWGLFANTAIYAANRIPEIADDIVNIDNAVKWGFAWDIGIFETWDVLGVKYACDRMVEDGLELPAIAKALLDAGLDSFYTSKDGTRMFFDMASKSYQPIPQNPKAFNILDAKEAGAVVEENESASLLDLGDGIVCAEFHTKMNTIDGDLLAMLRRGVELVNEGQFGGMVLANQGEHFSAGANLFMILGEIMQDNWDAVKGAVTEFQNTNMAMRFCKGPVVAAPRHATVGGGIEMSQHTGRCGISGET
ncbi:MAG: 3-hydroxyacyl-CoA dehydrogenase, partial [bacterium]|nr:3-hydroxyacyl-CoA dehydrogenase [bacterium]